jgi:hypothetical protein
VLLDANPLENISNVRRIRAVVARGRFPARTDLDATLAGIAVSVRKGTGCAADRK